MRGRTLAAVSLAVALLAGIITACATAADTPAEQVAAALDKSAVPATAFHQNVVGDKPTLLEVETFLRAATSDANERWQDYMVSRGAKRLDRKIQANRLIVNTTCPDRNSNGKSETVNPLSSDPFFCPGDNGGTLYAPVDSVRMRWLNSQRTAATMGPVVYTWVAAAWADAFMQQVYLYATSTLQVKGLQDPATSALDHYNTAQVFGWCIAGTLARAAQLDANTVREAVDILTGNDAGQAGNRFLFGEDLSTGVRTGKPGDCVRQYWPHS